MKYTYSAAFKEEGGKVYARTPDLDGCVTTGRNWADAIDQMSDTMEYRAKTDTKAVRKNVSLPAFLARLADRHRVNCSQVLQDALMAFSSMLMNHT